MITTIEKIEKEIITLAEFSKDQQSFIRGIVKLSYNEGLQKGQTLPIDSVSQQRELLLAFIKFYHSDDYSPENTTFKEDVDAFLAANNCG